MEKMNFSLFLCSLILFFMIGCSSIKEYEGIDYGPSPQEDSIEYDNYDDWPLKPGPLVSNLIF